MRIALDAMGGDHAPREIVRGVLEAAESHPDHTFLLVGDRDAVDAELSEANTAVPTNVVVMHASQTVKMDEKPVDAIRRKPDSSLLKAVELVGAHEADAVISAGNTGAMVAAGTFRLKPLEGVRRAGIAVNLPATGGWCTLIDVGANLNCKPTHLAQYAVMASIYHQADFQIERPRVGLLNVGQEESKGGPERREAAKMLAEMPVNFVGNAEGRDIFNGEFQVVVCDGFVGNALLKSTEGFGESLAQILRTAIFRDVWGRLSFNLMRPVLLNLQRKTDFASYGGAPLLGVEGGVIICHGRSSARAVRNAVGRALRFLKRDVNGQISAAFARDPAEAPSETA
jgi:glycerol-3-phosphate acyltransferase PlsX